ncbi:uncharacterized protein isoform X2 [Rhodnius prolixus]|uniref:uncharacterized protein isoform X2 n=1 Tax=Rhodnius prolixus TaxID=13249 RepID=UPI003D18C0FD
MSNSQNCNSEEASPDIYISATNLYAGNPTNSTFRLTDIPSNSTTYTAEEFLDNTDEGENIEEFDEANITKICSDQDEKDDSHRLGSAQKRNVTSVSDDEVHGRRRKSRRCDTTDPLQISSNDSTNSEISCEIDKMQQPDIVEKELVENKSKIPRSVSRKKKLPKKPEFKCIEKTPNKKTCPKDCVDNKSSPVLPTLKEQSQQKDKVEGANCTETESMPSLIDNTENENEKTPKRKPNTPARTPSRGRLTPSTTDKLPTHRIFSGKKITAIRPSGIPKLQKRVVKTPIVRPAFQASNQARTVARGSYVSSRPTVLNKDVAEKKPTDLSLSFGSFKDKSHKLSALAARYKIQLKRYNNQSKDLSGLSIMMESTKKSLVVLGEQITTLGGEVPPGDLDKLDSLPKRLSSVTLKTVSKTDKGTSPTALKEVIPDIVIKLQEEKKSLLAEIKKLQEENAYKIAWCSKSMDEMKNLENSSDLTDIKCKEALTRQSDLGHKLQECDKSIRELVSINREVNLCRTNLSKLKNELIEEKTKLEAERNSKQELESKLNQELTTERGKFKAEKVKRETLQSQLAKANNEKNLACQEKNELIQRLKEAQERLLFLDHTLETDGDRLQHMLQFLNEQEAVIKKSEAAIAELNEAKNNLENQIIEMDAGSKTAHTSVVEMSKQLLSKDEQLSKIKSQRDKAIRENTALSELLHFLAALNCFDISAVNFDEIINDPNAMVEIKEKVKELCRKPSSTITESLVREQAEQIKEQAVNIQKFKEEVKQQSERIQELTTSLNIKENEIIYLKAENNQQFKRMKILENVQQNEEQRVQQIEQQTERSMVDEKENETKEISIGSTGNKVTKDKLLTMLVAKSTALARMESKVKQLELVHSMCARRRARGESRIAQLESILQNDPSCWGNVISN